MADLFRRFGISCKTGYKWRRCFAAHGPAALVDRARRPARVAHQTSVRTEAKVLALRRLGSRLAPTSGRPACRSGCSGSSRSTACRKHLLRQRPAVGGLRPRAHHTHGVAAAAGRHGGLRPALPSTNAGQGRALPPHAEGRFARPARATNPAPARCRRCCRPSGMSRTNWSGPSNPKARSPSATDSTTSGACSAARPSRCGTRPVTASTASASPAFTLGLLDCSAPTDLPKGNSNPLEPAHPKCNP